jgi:hypothetical protein
VKKIGIIFILFGFFFPIILFLFTEFKGRGFSLKNIQSGSLGEVVVRNEVRYSEEELKKLKEEYKKKHEGLDILEKEDLTRAQGHLRLKIEENCIQEGIKKPAVFFELRYVYFLAFSLVIFAVGLGILLLSKKGGK